MNTLDDLLTHLHVICKIKDIIVSTLGKRKSISPSYPFLLQSVLRSVYFFEKENVEKKGRTEKDFLGKCNNQYIPPNGIVATRSGKFPTPRGHV